MYVPRRMDMGSDTLKPDSDVRFDEIARLDIMQGLRLGGLDATNDIDACRRVLGSGHEVVLREVEGGIQLSWHGIKVRCWPEAEV